MTSPVTVSLQVPYADTERQFLVLAVQSAVRAFRSMNARSDQHTSRFSSSRAGSAASASQVDQTKEALKES
jgi:hypothetical protein